MEIFLEKWGCSHLKVSSYAYWHAKCEVFRTSSRTITHSWPPSNLQSSFVIFHVRCVWNYVCEVTQCTFCRYLGSLLSKLLKSDAHFIWKASICMRNALRMSGLNFTCVFCVSVAYFKDSSWHNLMQFFPVTTILIWGQPYVQYKLALRVRSAIFVDYCIKSKQSTPANIYGGYAWFLSNGSNYLNDHYCV